MIKGSAVSADRVVATFRAEVAWNKVAERYPDVLPETITKVLQYAAERLAWDDVTLVDWTGCELVERVVGRCAGAPTVVGTRVFPDTIVSDYEFGCSASEIQANYPSLRIEVMEGLLEFAGTRQRRSAA